MPAVSAALIARTGSLTREVAVRCYAENALSARTVLGHPEVADRLVALLGTRPAEPRALAAQAKPVNDLSRGALVDDIVYTVALTAIQSRAG